MGIAQIESAFLEAQRLLRDSFLREGDEPKEAEELAAEMVSLPSPRTTALAELALLPEALGSENIPPEFERLVSQLDLGTMRIWDLNCITPMRLGSGFKDPYLDLVVTQTRDLRERGFSHPGIAFAMGTDDGVWFCASGPNKDFQRPVVLLDFETGDLFGEVADDIESLLFASARLAAEYYRLFSRAPVTGDWEEEVMAAVESDLGSVSIDWAIASVASRPRPV